jgi:hypothetical protein
MPWGVPGVGKEGTLIPSVSSLSDDDIRRLIGSIVGIYATVVVLGDDEE